MSIAEIITNISIHLMFLLIQPETGLPQAAIHFNTSHVSINRGGRQGNRPCQNISIHVSINQKLHCFSCRGRANFNTSHVSINPCGRRFPGSCGSISIHLMFLLILLPNGNRFVLKPFQYISCFY